MSGAMTRGHEQANGRNGRGDTGVRRSSSSGGGSSSLVDVLDHVLDKGIVIDAWVRVSLLGLELLTVEARVVIASVDTYLKYAEAIGATALAARPQPAAEPGRGQSGKQAEVQAMQGQQQQQPQQLQQQPWAQQLPPQQQPWPQQMQPQQHMQMPQQQMQMPQQYPNQMPQQQPQPQGASS